MAKCRMLIQENQELGRQLSQGRVAQLEAELALQKKYSDELKGSQDELNDFVIQLDEEVEGMQSTILTLQHQHKDCKQQLTQSQEKLLVYEDKLKTSEGLLAEMRQQN
ncbi:pre-mRNA-splicing regulator WTAP-like [Porites lutea]|uniref:pre-mRNA-splicing regulator WTAP-like n=1 Tax=Porites lutea TaxID=51062 RepID=UPI003CC52877